MARFAVLLLVVVALVLGPASSVAAGEEECAGASSLFGCPNVSAKSTGAFVVVTGDESSPGQTVVWTTKDGRAGGRAPLFVNQDPACALPQPRRPAHCFEAREPGAPAVDDTPTITISDIATFAPTPGRQQMEPDGWTVAGLDTNFYAITGAHVVNGTLLGRPADVRFTPVSYRWAYGDGTSATKSTGGGTWAAQGIREFDPTPTSHVYEQLGDYTITLSIVFAAEYRFAGGPWRPVVGTITLPANDLHIRVGTAKTVLVEHDCLANPSGPGC